MSSRPSRTFKGCTQQERIAIEGLLLLNIQDDEDPQRSVGPPLSYGQHERQDAGCKVPELRRTKRGVRSQSP